MTDDTPLDAEPTTDAEFEVLLGELLAATARNGVDPRGSWEYRNHDGTQDWELVVSELEKSDGLD